MRSDDVWILSGQSRGTTGTWVQECCWQPLQEADSWRSCASAQVLVRLRNLEGGGSILRCRIIFNSFHFTKMDNSIWVIQPNVFGSYKYHMVRKKEVWRSMYDILKIQSLTSVLKKTDIYIKYEILIQWSKYKGVDFLNKKCCNNSPLCIYTLWVTAPCHLNIWLALANGTMTNMT